jgi:hypothetical protein
MNFTKPGPNAEFTITADPTWPSVAFETDGTGAHTWNWTITWGTFTKSGTATTTDNKWDAKSAITDLGGTLTVRAEGNMVLPNKTTARQTATITVKIKGTDPAATAVKTYLGTKPNSDGFDKIIEHETHFKHFNAQGEPVKSFDNGYGLCQLTSPAPTFDQVWNWKKNVDGGLTLFASKRTTAISYLSQSGRTYTDDQLKHETVSLWNGGNYHTWDATTSQWVRKANILCDTATGNIGWNMDDAENTGKSEADLRARDKASYQRHTADAHWNYYGVCYADRVLG